MTLGERFARETFKGDFSRFLEISGRLKPGQSAEQWRNDFMRQPGKIGAAIKLLAELHEWRL